MVPCQQQREGSEAVRKGREGREGGRCVCEGGDVSEGCEGRETRCEGGSCAADGAGGRDKRVVPCQQQREGGERR